jgi:hypothetical protein
MPHVRPRPAELRRLGRGVVFAGTLAGLPDDWARRRTTRHAVAASGCVGSRTSTGSLPFLAVRQRRAGRQRAAAVRLGGASRWRGARTSAHRKKLREGSHAYASPTSVAPVPRAAKRDARGGQAGDAEDERRDAAAARDRSWSSARSTITAASAHAGDHAGDERAPQSGAELVVVAGRSASSDGVGTQPDGSLGRGRRASLGHVSVDVLVPGRFAGTRTAVMPSRRPRQPAPRAPEGILARAGAEVVRGHAQLDLQRGGARRFGELGGRVSWKWPAYMPLRGSAPPGCGRAAPAGVSSGLRRSASGRSAPVRLDSGRQVTQDYVGAVQVLEHSAATTTSGRAELGSRSGNCAAFRSRSRAVRAARG